MTFGYNMRLIWAITTGVNVYAYMETGMTYSAGIAVGAGLMCVAPWKNVLKEDDDDNGT